MNKTELIAAVAEKAELSKKDAEAAITATIDAITDSLKNGEKVQLVGFGSFEVKARAELAVRCCGFPQENTFRSPPPRPLFSRPARL